MAYRVLSKFLTFISFGACYMLGTLSYLPLTESTKTLAAFFIIIIGISATMHLCEIVGMPE